MRLNSKTIRNRTFIGMALFVTLPFIALWVGDLYPVVTPAGIIRHSTMQAFSILIAISWMATTPAPVFLMIKLLSKLVDISAEEYAIEAERKLEKLKNGISEFAAGQEDAESN